MSNPRYIILHWTGGNYKPNTTDKQHYQLLIDGEGNKIPNLPMGIGANTAGMNSITYNVACCGGLSQTPLKKKQCESMFEAVAQIIKQYNLNISDVYTHYEVGELCKAYQKGDKPNITGLLPWNNYLKDNIGKVDITILPSEYNATPENCGKIIRNKIKWYLEES